MYLPFDFSQISGEIEAHVADMKEQMSKNKPKLDEKKTAVLIAGDHTCL